VPWECDSVKLMKEDECAAVLKRGGKALARRKEAGVSINVLFAQELENRQIPTIRAFGTGYRNTPGNRHELLNLWRGKGNTNSTIKNVTSQVETHARPVIHAVYAFWQSVLDLRKVGVPSDEAAEALIFDTRELFEAVLEFADKCRKVAPNIKELHVTEADLVQFVAT
jgi:hypothetical protein